MQLIVIGAIGLGVFSVAGIIWGVILSRKRRHIEKAVYTEYEQAFSNE